jgi:2-polyprenyl-3-methyl-5-hydroxy-6-metoxy-1,4-benzoquinol methylase
MRLNEAAYVSDQYASEDNLQARVSIYAQHDGPDARDATFAAIMATSPRCVLEVGGGQGELAERIVRELGVQLTFVDQSERMVELARSRAASTAASATSSSSRSPTVPSTRRSRPGCSTT